MKFLVSTFIVFALLFTSSAAAFGQKAPARGLRTVGSLKRVESAVVFGETEGFGDGNGVLIRWKMVTETDNLGFVVVRVGKFENETVEGKFIPGSAAFNKDRTVAGEEYQLFDPDGTLSTEYQITSVERNGTRTTSKTFVPVYVSDLSSIAGRSFDSLYKQRSEATGKIASDSPLPNPELQAVIDESTQLADPVTQRWVAAQPGVKLGIRQTGMYRVSRAQLQAAGFNVNSDPALWQMYTDGVEQAILLGPNADYVDFYARGIDTVESDTRMYYLVAGPQSGKRMRTVSIRPSVSTVRVSNYDQTSLFKERFNYLLDIFNGEAENYFGHPVVASQSTFNVNLAGADTSAGAVQVKVKLIGYAVTAHAVNITLNGNPIGQATGTAGPGNVVTLSTTVPSSFLVDGANVVGTTNAGANDWNFFDSIEITYKRRYRALQNSISFTMPNYRGTTLGGFSSSNVRLFDITFDGEPMLVLGTSATANGSAFDLNIPAYRNRAMFAVEDSGLRAPASVAANIPSTLTTTAHDGKLVIISHRNFFTQANTWADYRRGQGTAVEVVDVDDIYDEFNYGVPSANSLRAFLDYARTNWQTPVQYALLIGDGSYDPRNYEGFGFWNLVPAKLVDTVENETASDDAMVDYNNDGLAELAIGRIPARTSADVTNAFNKTMAFETLSSTQNLSRGVVFHYDNPIGWNFQASSVLMRDQLPAGTPNFMIPRSDANPNAALVAELNNGRYLVNFAGHGTVGSLASFSNFNSGHVSLMTNASSPTVFTMLTCLTGFFHSPSSPVSMSEVMLNSTTGGAVASWASSGETTPDVQQAMGVRFYNQVGAGQLTRLGDLVVDAKSVLIAGRDVRLSWVLIGDPMLKMR